MIQNFEEFLATTSPNISVLGFVLNMFIAAVLSVILKRVYQKYGDSLSNRAQFGKNFMLITMTTMLIITIVKSSLALSLGLVGALSIIRFRAAIKEPEELAYLFLAISLGLGLGANQTGITIVAFVIIIVLIIIARKRSAIYDKKQNLILSVQSSGDKKLNMKNIVDILSSHCTNVDMKRFDETKETIEVMFIIETTDFDRLNNAKNELQELDANMKVSFLDNRGMV